MQPITSDNQFQGGVELVGLASEEREVGERQRRNKRELLWVLPSSPPEKLVKYDPIKHLLRGALN